MSKAILILDIDEKIHNSNVTSISFENRETIFFMKEVKLKHLPQKKEWKIPVEMEGENYYLANAFVQAWKECYEVYARSYVEGWNDCIMEILDE